MTLLARLYPITAPILRRVLRSGGPAPEVIQPAETEGVRPPAILPGMLDRVTGTDEHSELSFHLNVVRETQVTHAPVLRWTYRNALVRRNGFATFWHQQRSFKGRDLGELAGPIATMSTMRYCTDPVIWRYFGHWMSGGIPMSLIDRGIGGLWMPPRPDWTHADSYLQALDLTIVQSPVVLAKELLVYQDFGQGSHKRARYAIMRDRIQARFGGSGSGSCVYLRRGSTGAARAVANEDDFLEHLQRRNWQVLDVATASVDDMQRAVCQADIVVGMEGSHLNHAQISLRRGASMVILVPQDRFNTSHIGRCRAHDVSPGMVVLTGSAKTGYQVDVEEVLRTIDLAATLA